MFSTWQVFCKFEADNGEIELWGRKPKKPYLLDKATGLALLEEFSNCRNEKMLLSFLNKYGHPLFRLECDYKVDQEVDFHGDSGESVEKLLAVAANLYWLRTLLFEAQAGSRRLKNWLIIDPPITSRKQAFREGRGADSISFTMEPKEDKPANWKGYRLINGKKLASKFEISLGCSQLKCLDPNHDHVIEISRRFIVSVINQLIANVHPTLSVDFKPYLKAVNPWQAMCLALYEIASGESIAEKCSRPDCGNWISFVKEEGKRKKPSNTKWCSTPCKQWNYDQKRRGVVENG